MPNEHMESSSEIHGALSTDSHTKMDSSSQKHVTEFNENSIKAFVPQNDIDETTTIGMISVSGASVTPTNVTASEQSDSNKFSIRKYYSHVFLALVIPFMVVVILIPVIFFYTDSSEVDSFLLNIDFQSCSVSSYIHILYNKLCKYICTITCIR